MCSLRSTLLAGFAALALGAAAAQAQDKKKAAGPNADPKQAAATSPEVQAAEGAHTADLLARYGDARKDPLALIVAAKIKKEIGGQPLKADKTTKGGSGEAAAGSDSRTPEALLARARALARDRKDLLALADDVEKGGARGAVGGPKSGYTVVRSNATDSFRLEFEGGKPAFVGISGDGDSRLDLFVIDQNNNAVCRQEGPGDRAACRWTPAWTGPFVIQVRNIGIANRYRIWTN